MQKKNLNTYIYITMITFTIKKKSMKLILMKMELIYIRRQQGTYRIRGSSYPPSSHKSPVDERSKPPTYRFSLIPQSDHMR